MYVNKKGEKCKDITKPHWLIKGQVLVANICDFKKIESYLNVTYPTDDLIGLKKSIR